MRLFDPLWIRYPMDFATRRFQRSKKKQSPAQHLRRPLICGGSAPQFVRVPTGKGVGVIFLIRNAPNQCDDPSSQEAKGGLMKNLGYDRPLYMLPFDHRSSFELKMFGWGDDLTPEQMTEIAAAKQVIYDGFKAAVEAGVPREKAGILVDEQFGAAILRDAAARGYTFAYPVEKSGQDEFDFEYADDFAKHIEAFNPTFCKVLVRYNP